MKGPGRSINGTLKSRGGDRGDRGLGSEQYVLWMRRNGEVTVTVNIAVLRVHANILVFLTGTDFHLHPILNPRCDYSRRRHSMMSRINTAAKILDRSEDTSKPGRVYSTGKE